MFDLNAGIRAALMANTDLAAIVADRIYLDFAPQGSQEPYIVMVKISANREGAHDGDQALGRYRYQFNIGCNSKDIVDTVQFILEKQFNAVRYDYVDDATTYDLTFFHEDSRAGWNSSDRLYLPSVDLFIWVDN